MNSSPPARPLGAWETIAVTVAAFFGLYFGIPAYFAMMPWAERMMRAALTVLVRWAQ